MHEIDQRDRELLNVLQGEVPLASTPYAILGQMIDMSEKEVLKRCERLRRDGSLKQISGVFDSRALGYRTCLVAARIDGDDIERAASVINMHPGVSQNYKRNHDFNVWFTIAIPPNSRLGLERTVDLLGEEAGAEVVRMLPTLKLF
ncbi:MAG TPA: Lrp/AsnC family transcriptional regulator, partial [Thermoanaerobaculia bacterium]